MSLWYLGNELYKRGPNTVIAFSWRDCAGCSMFHMEHSRCSHQDVYILVHTVFHASHGFWLLFYVHCTIYIFHHMFCYLSNINNYTTFTPSLQGALLSLFYLSQLFRSCTSVILYDCKRSLNGIDSFHVNLPSMGSRAGSSTLVREMNWCKSKYS